MSYGQYIPGMLIASLMIIVLTECKGHSVVKYFMQQRCEMKMEKVIEDINKICETCEKCDPCCTGNMIKRYEDIKNQEEELKLTA